MPFAIGGNQLDTGYEVSNSLRFNDDDDPFLARTPSSSGSRTKATVSFWVKRGNLKASGNDYILEASSSTSPFNMTRVRFTDDLLIIDNTLNGNAGNGFYFQSIREYRDPSAWYHIFFSVDVTQANSTDGWRLYVNGVQQTKALDFWVQNANLEWSQSGVQMNIGRRHDNGTEHLDAYLTEFHYIDGTIKSFTDFGEFNDNGVWIPRKYDGGSYGTNGFYLEMKQTGTSANSSGIGADTSGNDNHFTPNNLTATDVTTDTCTNNFATLNSVDMHTTSPTIAEGNLDFHAQSGTPFTPARSTIAVSQGKWYMEYKFIDSGGGVGVMTTQSPINDHLRDDADVRSVYRNSSGGFYFGRNNAGAVDDAGGNSTTLSANDIGMIALDLDNGYVYFGKNGTFMNGIDGSTAGNPSGNNGGSGGAGNLASQLLTNQHDGEWAFMAFDISTSTTGQVQCNFGNAPYSISSGNADANGHGNFEYAPPSGFFALCTKNLAEYG